MKKNNVSSDHWLVSAEKTFVESITKHFNDAKTKRIAGIEIAYEPDYDKIGRAHKVIEELYKIKEFFAEKEIPVIAVLNKKIFRSLIAKLPFYSFKDIDEKGNVKVDTKRYVKLLNKKLMLPHYLFLTILFIGIFSVSSLTGNKNAIGSISSIVFCCNILGVIMMSINTFYNSTHNSTDSFFSVSFKEFGGVYEGLGFFSSIISTFFFGVQLVACVVTHYVTRPFFSSSMKKRLLFPNKVAEGEGTAVIELPPAPDSVKETLIKLSRAGIIAYPVVHEKAFKVIIDKEELAKWRRIILDPIIVSEHGDYLIVHAVYGDVPEEKKLIEKLKRTISQVTDEYISAVN